MDNVSDATLTPSDTSKPETQSTDQTSGEDSPKTGDESQPLLAAVVMIAAFCVMAAAVFFDRKKRHTD